MHLPLEGEPVSCALKLIFSFWETGCEGCWQVGLSLRVSPDAQPRTHTGTGERPVSCKPVRAWCMGAWGLLWGCWSSWWLS